MVGNYHNFCIFAQKFKRITMIKTILSIAGKPGLYRLVSQGRNMLIIESLETGKRLPAYSRDKVMSLGDIAIYTTGEDMPLGEVLELVKAKTDSKPVDIKKFANESEMRDYFGEILTTFDRERVHDSDIRKLFQWYNTLIAAGITDFVKKPTEEAEEVKTEGATETEQKAETPTETKAKKAPAKKTTAKKTDKKAAEDTK